MSRSSHYVRVLQAIVDDERAPAGERRAAAIAIEIHKARASGTKPAAHTPIPGESTTIYERVLTYEGGVWTVTCDGVRTMAWRGEGEIKPERPPVLEDYMGVYRQQETKAWVIVGRMDGAMSQELLPGMGVHLVVHLDLDPRLELSVMIFAARVSSIRWRLDSGRWWQEVELIGYRKSGAAERANRAVRALPAAPGEIEG